MILGRELPARDVHIQNDIYARLDDIEFSREHHNCIQRGLFSEQTRLAQEMGPTSWVYRHHFHQRDDVNREEFRVRTPDSELSVEDLTVPAVGIDDHPLLTPRLSRQPSVTL